MNGQRLIVRVCGEYRAIVWTVEEFAKMVVKRGYRYSLEKTFTSFKNFEQQETTQGLSFRHGTVIVADTIRFMV